MLSDRDRAVISLVEKGESLKKIAAQFSISRQRVHQILKRESICLSGYQKHSLEEEYERMMFYWVIHPETEMQPCTFEEFQQRHYNNLGIPKKKREGIFYRDQGRCHYCEREISLKTFHIDHKIPRHHNGSHENENLVAACKDCNLKKGTKNYEDFYLSRQKNRETETRSNHALQAGA